MRHHDGGIEDVVEIVQAEVDGVILRQAVGNIVFTAFEVARCELTVGKSVWPAREGSTLKLGVRKRGVTGFIVNSEDEALLAIERAGQLDRNLINACFERHFTAETMTRAYVSVYGSLIRPRRLTGSEGLP
jgi:hypothetical protein